GKSTRRSRSSRPWSGPGTTSPKAPTISLWRGDEMTAPPPTKRGRGLRKQGFLGAAAQGAGAWGRTAQARPRAQTRTHQGPQQPKRLLRIGVLNAAWAASHPTVEGLKAGLKELGLEDGRDVTFDIRFTEGKLNAIPPAAEALVKARVDLIFTSQEAA